MSTNFSVEEFGADNDHLHVAPPDRNALADTLMANVREPLIVLDRTLRIVAASRSYRRMFPAKVLNVREGPDAEPPPWDLKTRALLESVLSQHAMIEGYEIELDTPDLGRRQILLSAHGTRDQGGHDNAIVIGLEDVTAQRDAEKQRIALQEKQDTLLHEVHHRVANSLQIVASILLLKARAVQSEETRAHLRDVHHRLISVATVQHQLSVATPGNEVELGPYLVALCDGLARSMISDDQAITVTATATAGAIPSEDAASFGLIVTELVINSLKHGFPDGRNGHIIVVFARDGADWRLSVSDDGVGRDPHPVEAAHVGLGTSIVEALARNLNARVEIAPAGPGATTAIVHSG
jgi:two-component sensor histidine kinase